MSILLSLFIFLLIATYVVWTAAYWPNKPVDVLAEVQCPLPTTGSAAE